MFEEGEFERNIEGFQFPNFTGYLDIDIDYKDKPNRSEVSVPEVYGLSRYVSTAMELLKNARVSVPEVYGLSRYRIND